MTWWKFLTTLLNNTHQNLKEIIKILSMGFIQYITKSLVVSKYISIILKGPTSLTCTASTFQSFSFQLITCSKDECWEQLKRTAKKNYKYLNNIYIHEINSIFNISYLYAICFPFYGTPSQLMHSLTVVRTWKRWSL